MNFKFIWTGLTNPDFVAGTNAALDNLLTWSDGTNYTYTPGLPTVDTETSSPLACNNWQAKASGNGKITPRTCASFPGFYICEYECGNGKPLKKL